MCDCLTAHMGRSQGQMSHGVYERDWVCDGGTAAVPEGKGCASGSSALSEHVGAYLSQATQGKDSVNTCRMQGEQEGEISDIGDSVQGARHCGGNAESRAWC